MNILVVEDDHSQAQAISSSLVREFPDCQVDLISTEQEFRVRLADIVQNPPDAIVLDIMLRWTDPRPEMPVWPDDVKAEGPHRAGFRCKGILSRDLRTKNIPVILYTVLEVGDIQHELSLLPVSDLHYLRKEGDLTPLLRRIRELITPVVSGQSESPS